MKFLVSATARAGGSPAEIEVALSRLMDLYGKWAPPSDMTVHQFFGRLDGRGAYLVVETDNPHSLAEGPMKFTPFFDYEIVPIADVAEAAGWVTEAIQFRE